MPSAARVWCDFLVGFPLPNLPFVAFLERGELKKNFGVGSIYLRAKEKRVTSRPVFSPGSLSYPQAQIRHELLEKQ